MDRPSLVRVHTPQKKTPRRKPAGSLQFGNARKRTGLSGLATARHITGGQQSQTQQTESARLRDIYSEVVLARILGMKRCQGTSRTAGRRLATRSARKRGRRIEVGVYYAVH